MRYVALTGTAGSGKTAVAQLLKEQYNYRLANFTDRIKHDLAERLGISVGDILNNKEVYRIDLQALGSTGGYDNGGVHVFRALKDCGWTANPEFPVVFDNVRTDGQAETLRWFGIPVIKIVVSPVVAAQRLGHTVPPEWMFNPIESGVSAQYIHQIVGGEQPIDAVVRTIVRLPDVPTPDYLSDVFAMWERYEAYLRDSSEALHRVLGGSPVAS